MKLKFYFPILFLFFSCCENPDVPGDSDESLMASSYTSSDRGMGIDTAPPPMGGGQGSIDPGVITAGEWNDLNNWEFWRGLVNSSFDAFAVQYSINPIQRYSIEVINSSGNITSDIPVELIYNNSILWKTRTDNKGMAELWPNSYSTTSDIDPLLLKIKINGQLRALNLNSFENGINRFFINEEIQPSRQVDIAFMVDATGSMGDELEYLKVELMDVINRVKQNNQQLTLNMGTVFYRDVEDEYLTRKSDFSSDIQKTITFIQKQMADGGGDYPEAVHTALEESINQLSWSNNALARLLFIVLDAPPHDEEQVIDQIGKEITRAAEKGIKIIPVSASGIDKGTEFLLRSMAIITNGTYVFITDDSGIGGDHIEPTIGEYEVEYLNDLLVRLIGDYTTQESL